MDEEMFRKRNEKKMSFLETAFNRLGGIFSKKTSGQDQAETSGRSIFDRVRGLFFFHALWISVLVIGAGFLLFRLTVKSPPGVKHITLVFAQWWEDELEGNVLAKLAAEFETENPNVTINLEKKSWGEIRESLDGDQGPDMFSIDPYDIYELNRSFRLAAVTGDEDNPGTVLPLTSFINPLFYNIDLLRNAGFDRPPKNQTEFLSYVRRIGETGNGGVYGAGLALGGDSSSVTRHILSWIWASASGTESAEKFKFNSKEVTGALNFLNQLRQNLYPAPFYLTEADLLKAFSDGRVAMMIGSSADIQKLKTKAAQINFGITTIPASESYTKKPVFPLTLWYAAINGESLYRAEARQFAAFLKEKSESIAAAAYAVPGKVSENVSRDVKLSRDDPYYAKAFDMYEAGEMVRERYELSDISILNEKIRQEVKKMFEEIQTPEQCAEAIQQGWEQLVREWEGNAGAD